mgnify:FL=1
MSTFTGYPQIFSGRPPVADEVNPSHALGELMVAADGRAYRYVLAGTTALVVGNVVQAAAEDTGDQGITPTAAAVGDTSLVSSSTMTVTANQYAGGYIVVTVTPGLGQVFRIKSHAAYTAVAATFELEDPIQVALTTTSRIDFVPNIYNGVVVAPTTATSCAVGLVVNDITASRYGWVQVAGPAAVTNDAAGAITVGTQIMPSTSVAGSIRAITGTGQIIGVATTGIASGETGLARLQIN